MSHHAAKGTPHQGLRAAEQVAPHDGTDSSPDPVAHHFHEWQHLSVRGVREGQRTWIGAVNGPRIQFARTPEAHNDEFCKFLVRAELTEQLELKHDAGVQHDVIEFAFYAGEHGIGNALLEIKK
jgi:hypothetical protein